MITMFSNTRPTVYSRRGLPAVHCERPTAHRIERALDVLQMDYLAGLAYTARCYGSLGVVVQFRRELRSAGSFARFAGKIAGWLWDDIRYAPRALLHRAIGTMGAEKLLRLAYLSNRADSADTAIIAALEAVTDGMHPERVIAEYDEIMSADLPLSYALSWQARNIADKTVLSLEQRTAVKNRLFASYRAENPNTPSRASDALKAIWDMSSDWSDMERGDHESITLGVLLWKLWLTLDTDEQRVKFLHRASEYAALGLEALTQQQYGDFDMQVWHAGGDTEAILSFLCDDCNSTDRRQMFDGWRARGLGWLADHYAPLVAERLGLTTNYTDLAEAA